MHKVGWHLGRAEPMSGGDWSVIRAVPPVSVTFSSGLFISGDDIRRILEISPQCHIFMRPYYPPSDQEKDFRNYLEGVKADIAPGNWEFIPEGQRHLQIFNEQNMPRDSQWEGFGPSWKDIERFNRWFCIAYDELKAVNPTWKIAFPALTPGNRDAYFRTDPENVPYYMHGPEAAKENPAPEEIRAAIRSGPCYEALKRSDEYLAHIYVVNDVEHQMYELWSGLRFVQYARFLPKPMDIWITELGIGGHPQNWARWFQLLDNYPEVKGTSIWIVGETIRSDGDPQVKELKKYVASLPHAPTVGFEASVATGRAPLTVRFTDKSAGEVRLWRWDFGDGGRSSERHPTHVYREPGTYSVTLRTYGPGGEGVKAQESLIQVQSAAPATVVATFSATPTSGTAPLTVHFSDQSTGQVTGWRWDFGDGHTSITRSPQHTYEVVGSHTVSLTVSGPAGSATETKASLVTVDRKIEAEIEPIPIDEEMHFDTVEEAVRNKAWNEMAVAYNPDAGFPRYARQHGLGAPLTAEADAEFEGKAYRLQGFVGGIVFTEVGQWDQVSHLEW